MRIARELMARNPLITQDEANALAAQLEAASEKTSRAVDDMQRLRQAAFDVGDAFSSAFERAILDGGKLSDVLKGLARDILAIIVRRAVSEPIGNAIGSAISGMFGGGRAIGGPVAAGVPYMVGEKGPEMFVPTRAGKIVPNGHLGGGAAPVINQSWTIDARGADAAAVERLERAFQADRAVRAVETRAIVRDANQRRLPR
jgi:phage-related minor tail protein